MKSALLGITLGLGIAIIALGGSCSINHRTGDYACTTQADCATGRTCTAGFCVVTGTNTPDAPKLDGGRVIVDGGSGSGNCPSGCTSCNATTKQCTIDCGSGANCQNAVVCPQGWHCTVDCDTQGSCRNGVFCGSASSCTVNCTAQNSCQGVTCGAGRCDVSCAGPNSCKGVTCNNSCACDVMCTGNMACQSINCTSLACDTTSGGCTSLPTTCHSCM